MAVRITRRVPDREGNVTGISSAKKITLTKPTISPRVTPAVPPLGTYLSSTLTSRTGSGSSAVLPLVSRGNYVSTSEAVRDVRYSVRASQNSRALGHVTNLEPETFSIVRRAGGTSSFLFAQINNSDLANENARRHDPDIRFPTSPLDDVLYLGRATATSMERDLRSERQRVMRAVTGDDDSSAISSRQGIQQLSNDLTGIRAFQRSLQMGNGTISQDYAELMRAVLGFSISFDGSYSETQRMTQLSNLAKASLQVINYINQVTPHEDFTTARHEFARYFATSRASQHDVYSPITIHLGAEGIISPRDPDAAREQGLTPMPINNADAPEELFKLYLGGNVSPGTIIHELYHQFDRYFGGAAAENYDDFLYAMSDEAYRIGYSAPMLTRAARDNPRTEIIESDFPTELFPDWGMTATAAISPGMFYVESDNPHDIIGFRDIDASDIIQPILDEYFAYIFTHGSLPPSSGG